MSVEFKEVFANCGFTAQTPTGGPGIIVPQDGATFFVLEGGKHLKVGPADNAPLRVDEIKDDQRRHEAVTNAPFPTNPKERASVLALLKSGSSRVFKITAGKRLGYGLKIEVVNPPGKKPEAALKVIILKQKPVTIAIRPVRVLDDTGAPVNSSLQKDFNAKGLLDQMNAIWTPQANVVFALGKTDPVTLKNLRPGQPADITDVDLKSELMRNKDGGSALTFFMVKRAVNKDSKDLGVINSEAGISLISDDRSDSTMAHEAGHFLGSLSESGKFTKRYGHQGTDASLLMRDGGAGYKIPYDIVTDFNKGYTN